MVNGPRLPPAIVSALKEMHTIKNIKISPQLVEEIRQDARANAINKIIANPFFRRLIVEHFLRQLSAHQVEIVYPESFHKYAQESRPPTKEAPTPPPTTKQEIPPTSTKQEPSPPTTIKQEPTLIQEEVIEVLPFMEELPTEIMEGGGGKGEPGALPESSGEGPSVHPDATGSRVPAKTDQELRAARREMLTRLSNGFTQGDFLFIIRLTKWSQGSDVFRQAPSTAKEAKASVSAQPSTLASMEEFIADIERLNQEVYALRGELEALLGQIGRGIEGKMKQILLIHQEIGQLLLEAKEGREKQSIATSSQQAQMEMLKAKLEQLKLDVHSFLAKFDQLLSKEKGLFTLPQELGEKLAGKQAGLISEAGTEAGKPTTAKQVPPELATAAEKAKSELQIRAAPSTPFAAPAAVAEAAATLAQTSTPTPLQMPIPVRTVADFMKSLQLVQVNLNNKTMQVPITFIVPFPTPTKIESTIAKAEGKAKDLKEEEEGEMEGEGPAQERALLFSYIPEGPALLGDFFNEGKEDELPLRQIYCKAFLISTTPITNLQYTRWLNTKLASQHVQLTPTGEVKDKHGTLLLYTVQKHSLSQIQIQTTKGKLRFAPLPGKEHHPVVAITYFGAEVFCEDNGFRLPTEAEWEKAASMEPYEEEKPLKKFRYGCGSNELNLSLANYTEGFSSQRKKENLSFPVGFYNGNTVFIRAGKRIKTEDGKSPFGCYDMCGNVHQWVDEWNNEHLERVTKGGGYDSAPFDVRVSARVFLNPNTADPATGFRVVLDLP